MLIIEKPERVNNTISSRKFHQWKPKAVPSPCLQAAGPYLSALQVIAISKHDSLNRISWSFAGSARNSGTLLRKLAILWMPISEAHDKCLLTWNGFVSSRGLPASCSGDMPTGGMVKIIPVGKVTSISCNMGKKCVISMKKTSSYWRLGLVFFFMYQRHWWEIKMKKSSLIC